MTWDFFNSFLKTCSKTSTQECGKGDVLHLLPLLLVLPVSSGVELGGFDTLFSRTAKGLPQKLRRSQTRADRAAHQPGRARCIQRRSWRVVLQGRRSPDGQIPADELLLWRPSWESHTGCQSPGRSWSIPPTTRQTSATNRLLHNTWSPVHGLPCWLWIKRVIQAPLGGIIWLWIVLEYQVSLVSKRNLHIFWHASHWTKKISYF